MHRSLAVLVLATGAAAADDPADLILTRGRVWTEEAGLPSRLQRRPHPSPERRAVPRAGRPDRGPVRGGRASPHQSLRRGQSTASLGPRPRLALRLVPRGTAHEGGARTG